MSKAIELLKEAINLLETKENGENYESAVSNNCMFELSTFVPGDIIKGNETDTEYIVLEHLPDGTTAVISKDFMLENVMFDADSPNYAGSNLQKEIEEKCVSVFEKDFGAENIIEREVDLTTVDMQQRFKNIRCKVSPLTFDEARKYNDLIVNKDLEDYGWLITAWSTEERGWKYSVAVVSPSGSIRGDDCRNDYLGVRPFCILKSNIFVSKGE